MGPMTGRSFSKSHHQTHEQLSRTQAKPVCAKLSTVLGTGDRDGQRLRVSTGITEAPWTYSAKGGSPGSTYQSDKPVYPLIQQPRDGDTRVHPYLKEYLLQCRP